MRMHPALKAAMSMFRKSGMTVHQVGSLSFHVCCREYAMRPCIVDLKLSSHDNKGRIDVCEFSSEHPMFAQAMTLHNQEFTWKG